MLGNLAKGVFYSGVAALSYAAEGWLLSYLLDLLLGWHFGAREASYVLLLWSLFGKSHYSQSSVNAPFWDSLSSELGRYLAYGFSGALLVLFWQVTGW